jgi:hypothetical protein
MLALTDEALARIALGATRIAPEQRHRWLKRVAKELEGHRPSPTARRLRKFQARRHNGQACYRVVQDCVDLEELLLASGTLAPADRDDHGKVEAALSRFLSLCIADHRNTFQPDREIYDRVRVGLCLSALRRKVSDGPPKRRPSR